MRPQKKRNGFGGNTFPSPGKPESFGGLAFDVDNFRGYPQIGGNIGDHRRHIRFDTRRLSDDRCINVADLPAGTDHSRHRFT